jgi:hypothetical protein
MYISDINECNQFLGICQNGGQCVNTIGSYRCQCPPGWTGTNCTVGKLVIYVISSQVKIELKLPYEISSYIQLG